MHAEHIVAGRRKAVPESLETWRLIFKKTWTAVEREEDGVL